MNRYEYLTLKILNTSLKEQLLNQKGSEGWQLITVDNNIFYFMRHTKENV